MDSVEYLWVCHSKFLDPWKKLYFGKLVSLLLEYENYLKSWSVLNPYFINLYFYIIYSWHNPAFISWTVNGDIGD